MEGLEDRDMWHVVIFGAMTETIIVYNWDTVFSLDKSRYIFLRIPWYNNRSIMDVDRLSSSTNMFDTSTLITPWVVRAVVATHVLKWRKHCRWAVS